MTLNSGWQIGRAHITPLYETDAGAIIQAGIANATPENIRQIPWLRPHFADANGAMKAVVQAFLIVVEGKNILVDSCVGNSKSRPGLPAWNQLDTDFLARLTEQGVEPYDVDVVVCTHLHFDHVGWNTVSINGTWVPTFAKARYVLNRNEFRYWRKHPEREVADDRAGFNDSVLPVIEAGLMDLVAPNHEICGAVRLLPTGGHTPGHVSVLVESEGQRAIISGDAIHHPCQVAHPEWGIYSDFDPEHARRSRLGLLEHCADFGTILIGTHFASPTAITIHRDGSGFKAG
jgi:glyoxylase-like metal-dependent hydrolase (beta-lactamase superfamily II)